MKQRSINCLNQVPQKKKKTKHNISTAQSSRPSTFHFTNGSFEYVSNSKNITPNTSLTKKKNKQASTTARKKSIKEEDNVLYAETQRFIETKKKFKGNKIHMTVDEKKKKKKYESKQRLYKFSLDMEEENKK